VVMTLASFWAFEILVVMAAAVGAKREAASK